MVVRRGTTNRNARGSAADRRARRRWLLDTFGDGVTAVCSFDDCDTVLTFDTITADRYPIPGVAGGRYVRGNIRPACLPCNERHGGALAGLTKLALELALVDPLDVEVADDVR